MEEFSAFNRSRFIVPIKTELSYESLRNGEDVISNSRDRSDFHQDVGNHKETVIAWNREERLVKLMAQQEHYLN
ncbi:hypothetical protein TNCT_468831 [Trichonephila clavata]|uniref:Uncharacterized protein n=1 Tax=Trichonephila clavata TaxID=2740835 RepID=A0A8X6HLW5_TRICU|nr:hypothetical protein TNCT_468831 [Trichonephila clavata]